MATWHQMRAPCALYHPTQYTVVTDPPNALRTIMRFADQVQADAHLAGLRLHQPALARFSYLIKPQ